MTQFRKLNKEYERVEKSQCFSILNETVRPAIKVLVTGIPKYCYYPRS